MEQKITFAPTVMLIDAAYLDRVVADMRAHFSQVLNRELPKADLARLLECIGLDAGLRGKDHAIQVLFLYDANRPQLTACTPSDFEKELHNVAFQGSLGEFSLYSFQPSSMATCEELVTESLQLVGESKETQQLIVVPDETAYGAKLDSYFAAMKDKKSMQVFGMNPPTTPTSFDFQLLGFAILQALGIKPDEL